MESKKKLNEDRMNAYGLKKEYVDELMGRMTMWYLDKGTKHYWTRDENCRYDVLATSTTRNQREVHEIKCYWKEEHARFSNGVFVPVYNYRGEYMHDRFKEYDELCYVCDYDKPEAVVERANIDGSTPLLWAFLWDGYYVWDLNKARWRETKHLASGNKHGDGSGGKELTWKAKFYFDVNNGMLIEGSYPSWFTFDLVKDKINERYPGLFE